MSQWTLLLNNQFNKEVNNGRWRAYSKGSIELCEKYSAHIMQGRSQLVDAPKDIHRLEVLKPVTAPSMRERYDAAVSKEKRLEAVTNPLVSSKNKTGKHSNNKSNQKIANAGEEESSDDERFEDCDSSDEGNNQTDVAPKRKFKAINDADLKNVKALEEEDEVQDGIIWSDSE